MWGENRAKKGKKSEATEQRKKLNLKLKKMTFAHSTEICVGATILVLVLVAILILLHASHLIFTQNKNEKWVKLRSPTLLKLAYGWLTAYLLLCVPLSLFIWIASHSNIHQIAWIFFVHTVHWNLFGTLCAVRIMYMFVQIRKVQGTCYMPLFSLIFDRFKRK